MDADYPRLSGIEYGEKCVLAHSLGEQDAGGETEAGILGEVKTIL